MHNRKFLNAYYAYAYEVIDFKDYKHGRLYKSGVSLSEDIRNLIVSEIFVTICHKSLEHLLLFKYIYPPWPFTVAFFVPRSCSSISKTLFEKVCFWFGQTHFQIIGYVSHDLHCYIYRIIFLVIWSHTLKILNIIFSSCLSSIVFIVCH